MNYWYQLVCAAAWHPYQLSKRKMNTHTDDTVTDVVQYLAAVTTSTPAKYTAWLNKAKSSTQPGTLFINNYRQLLHIDRDINVNQILTPVHLHCVYYKNFVCDWRPFCKFFDPVTTTTVKSIANQFGPNHQSPTVDFKVRRHQKVCTSIFSITIACKQITFA